MHIVVFDCAMKIKNIFVNFCVTFMQDDKAERQKTETQGSAIAKCM